MGIREQILQMAEQKAYKESYQQGYTEICKERNIIFIENLLCTTDFTDEKIAGLVAVNARLKMKALPKNG